jgi:hypothetical protein
MKRKWKLDLNGRYSIVYAISKHLKLALAFLQAKAFFLSLKAQ